MPTGLQSWSEDGLAQVDTSFPNMGLRQKIVNPTGPFTVTAKNPVVFHTGSGHMLSVVPNGNGTWTFSFNQLAANTTFFVFDDMASIPPDVTGCGIESFDANGARIFSSMHPPLRIVHASQLPAQGQIGGELHAYNGGGGASGGVVGGSPYGPSFSWAGLPPGLYAGMLTTYRYGAIGSSTVINYGDPMYEMLLISSAGFTVQGVNMGSGNENFGGFHGSSYDPGYVPMVILIDISNY